MGRTASCLLILLGTAAVTMADKRQDKAGRKIRSNPTIRALYDDVKLLVAKDYPDATSHVFQDVIHFEHRTQLYIIPAFVKLPRGQEVPLVEVRGPQPGGVWCRIELKPGRAAPYPRANSSIGRDAFTETIIYSVEKYRTPHLYATLRLPTKPPYPAFRKALQQLVDRADDQLKAE